MKCLTWLETNVPALRHVVVANPGGRRWLELWNMAITQKAEDYYRIVNNLLDNSGAASQAWRKGHQARLGTRNASRPV